MGCSASRPDILIGKAVEGSASSFFSTSHSPGGAVDFRSTPSTPSGPKSRFIPAPLVHHPAMRKGDSHHLVSLTSTTYGSLIIVDHPPSSSSAGATGEELNVRDSTDQSPSPDSVINTWELMEGLEDEDEDFRSISSGNPNSLNSFSSGCSIDARRNPNLKDDLGSISAGDSINQLSDTYVFVEKPHEILSDKMGLKVSNGSSKPLWKHLSEESLLSKLDPSVASSYERALCSKQPGFVRPITYTRSVGSSPLCLKPNSVGSAPLVPILCDDNICKPRISEDDNQCKPKALEQNNKSKIPVAEDVNQCKISALDQNNNYKIPGAEDVNQCKISALEQNNNCKIPGAENKILLYLTSLRGIRRTYEDCCEVRMIFRAFKVLIDERDVSMDSRYKEELREALGGKLMSLPRVFIRGKYIGGVEEIKQLNEDGELAKMLAGFPVIKDHSGFVCESCGDARFVPCGNCNGSRKVFDEVEDRMRRCLDCNENGLIRCPVCCL